MPGTHPRMRGQAPTAQSERRRGWGRGVESGRCFSLHTCFPIAHRHTHTDTHSLLHTPRHTHIFINMLNLDALTQEHTHIHTLLDVHPLIETQSDTFIHTHTLAYTGPHIHTLRHGGTPSQALAPTHTHTHTHTHPWRVGWEQLGPAR